MKSYVPIHSADALLWMLGIAQFGGANLPELILNYFWGENKSKKVAHIACMASE